MRTLRAITFDLDDTLWPSAPTLARAEQRAHAWIAANAPPVAARWPIVELRELRMSLYRAHPELHHNLLQIRRLAMHAAFEQAGVTGNAADELIEQSLKVFMAARHEVDLYPEVRDCLARLSQRYALAALTNGNADVTVIGLGHFFAAKISPHTHGVIKPELDIRGARGAGMPALWINRTGAAWEGGDAPDAVTNLLELEQWLARE
jgi:FMN hydrolase / 5-amino-6-(5-phospho-D-ribitylamino)uracil phosphatase